MHAVNILPAFRRPEIDTSRQGTHLFNFIYYRFDNTIVLGHDNICDKDVLVRDLIYTNMRQFIIYTNTEGINIILLKSKP